MSPSHGGLGLRFQRRSLFSSAGRGPSRKTRGQEEARGSVPDRQKRLLPRLRQTPGDTPGGQAAAMMRPQRLLQEQYTRWT
jgi:hypothetical protein